MIKGLKAEYSTKLFYIEDEFIFSKKTNKCIDCINKSNFAFITKNPTLKELA